MQQEQEVEIPLTSLSLMGNLFVPETARGIVVFVHGSGSSRLSPRNRAVASYLQQKGLGTLLFDLLSFQEDQDYANRFDIALLTQRLITVTGWLQQLEASTGKEIGYFGASTGAAAAISAAAVLPEIKAIVSRGGRPDMAAGALSMIHAPTLLIVGGDDYEVLQLNQSALAMIHSEKDLKIIDGATHLFEEPGAMEQVTTLAFQWFQQYL